MEKIGDSFIHSLDPVLLHLFKIGDFEVGIRWYGLAYLGGFIAAYYIMYFMSKRGLSPLRKDRVDSFLFYLIIGTMAGGRIGYALFYDRSLLTSFHSSPPFWGLLEVHKGGMASHGGIIGVIIACWLYSRKDKGVPILHLIDLTVLGGTLGIFFGRIANFINGELYGRAASQGFALAVKFPQETYRWLRDGMVSKLKTLGPAIESLPPVEIGGEVIDATAATWSQWLDQGLRLNYYKVQSYLEQLVHASEQGQRDVLEALAPVLTPRHPSQIYQALWEGLAVFLILLFLWRKPQKPGFISAMCGLLYALARIAGEQFRLPDAHIGYEWLGLTRGQWLSVVMLTGVIVYLIYTLRRDSKPIGGWQLLRKTD